jgi:hypothetical protein
LLAAVTLFKQRTLADRVLEQCQSVKIAATALLQSFDNCSTSLKVPLYETNDVRSYCIEANVALELLVEQVIIWTTEQAEGNMDSQLSRELKAKLRDVTRKVGVNVARLMQVCKQYILGVIIAIARKIYRYCKAIWFIISQRLLMLTLNISSSTQHTLNISTSTQHVCMHAHTH